MLKGLIAAGGRGTRLRPLTHAINKHLIPIGNKPLITYAIEKMAAVGIREIAININPGETDIPQMLGDGSRWGVSLTFLEQEGGPRGVGHIVKNAEAWIGNAPFMFYLGDNVMLGSLQPLVDRFEQEGLDCLLALARVQNLSQFGVPEIKDGRIVRVVEKPTNPPSPFAVTGIYLYGSTVFDAARVIQPSARGEYEISDIHTVMIEQGRKVGFAETTGNWMDTGRPEDLLRANALLLAEQPALIAPDALIDGSVWIEGSVSVGSGAQITEGTVVRGPVSIGAGCVITGGVIGPNVSIGAGSRVTRAMMTDSLVMEKATCQGVSLTASILGRGAVVSSQATMQKPGRTLLGDQGVVEW
jgi:glucose-1-phosphate thymidylyltransferase